MGAGGSCRQNDGQGAGPPVSDSRRGRTALKPFFKAGDAGPRTLERAELSQFGQGREIRRAAGPEPAAATKAAPSSAGPAPRTTMKSSPPEPKWQRPFITAEANPTFPQLKNAASAPLRPRVAWYWLAAAAGVLLIGLEIAWFADVLPTSTTDSVAVGQPAPESPPPPVAPARQPPPPWTSPSTQMTLLSLEGGDFSMGSPYVDGDGADNERPPHRVFLSPFYLGISEVTQEQYRALMQTNPSWFSSTGGGRETVSGRSTNRFPVEHVSWLDAVRFCNASSKKDGLRAYYDIADENVRISSPNGSGYRLPTEAEWEYACRAGKPTKYCYGDDPSKLGDYAWYLHNSERITHPIKQRLPNGFGLYDMHGNVWEWCQDGYDAAYYQRSPRADPPGESDGSHRVIRGGCSYDGPRDCRSACRSWNLPAYRGSNLGFRVALSQPVR